MKKTDLKELVKKAQVEQDQEILGTKKDGSPKYGKKLNNFQVRIKRPDDVVVSIGIPASTEAEARKNVFEHLTNPEIPKDMRQFDLEDVGEPKEK